MKLKTSLWIIPLLMLGAFACKKKQSVACNGTDPAYYSSIKVIIDTNCMNGSCHGSGSKNGDFTTYSGLSEVISNGKFEKKVLKKQTMPRGFALTQDEINTVQCWVENGYREN